MCDTEENPSKETEYYLTITVPEYVKVSQGHVTYIVQTKTNIPFFKGTDFAVRRRFSDFLGLYEELLEKNSKLGVIIAMPPEKNFLNTTLLKLTNKNNDETEFLEHRRIELEKYLQRLAMHSTLSQDSVLMTFLTFQDELPKASNTKTLSSASAKKLIKSFSSSLRISTLNSPDEDYFLVKIDELEQWEQVVDNAIRVTKLLSESHISLAQEIASLFRVVKELSENDENENSKILLGELSRLYEKSAELAHIQSQADTIFICDSFKSLLKMIFASRQAIYDRVEIYLKLKDAESALNSKRVEKAKAELRNSAIVPFLTEHVVEIEKTVSIYEELFSKCTIRLKKEFQELERHNYIDLKTNLIKYSELIIRVQGEYQDLWKEFLDVSNVGIKTEAKGIKD